MDAAATTAAAAAAAGFLGERGLLCQQQPVQPAAIVNSTPMSALILKKRGVISGHSDDSFFSMLTRVNIPFIFLVGCLFTLSHAVLKVRPVPL